MVDKIAILIHGPYKGNALKKILENYYKLSECERSKIHIVLVSYVADLQKNILELESCNALDITQIISVKDVFNPGFFNINRQLITVQAGLQCIEDDSFIIKLRNDQWVSFRKLIKVLNNNNWLQSVDGKQILSSNCFTRKDRLYHPSDMLLCGWKRELEKYYDCPCMEQTQLSFSYEMIIKCEQNPGNFVHFFQSPEKILFMNYLNHCGWECTGTFEDSENALKRYICLVNSWDIGFRWNKARNPFLKEGTIILPYFFTVAPFQSAPKEKARCYMRHDIEENAANIKDLYYIMLARLLYFVKYTINNFLRIRLHNLADWARGNRKVLYILQHSPFWKPIAALSRKFRI